MVLVKILKRKDASSLIVAIVIGTIIWQAISFMSGDLAIRLSGLKNEYGLPSFVPPDSNWKQIYLQPAVAAVVQLVFLEIIAWLVIATEMLFKQSKPLKKK
jgi:hypothetical protein